MDTAAYRAAQAPRNPEAHASHTEHRTRRLLEESEHQIRYQQVEDIFGRVQRPSVYNRDAGSSERG